MTTEQIVTMAEEYNKGKKLREIASIIDCSYQSVHNTLIELRKAGVLKERLTKEKAIASAVKILKEREVTQ